MKSIQVFEHQTLAIGEQGFGQNHYDSLQKYNDSHQQKYFTFLHKKIKFTSYVGVIKVGNISFEILPKIDRLVENNWQNAEEEKNFWQNVLIDMLRVCRNVKLNSYNKANLKLRHNKLFDIFYLSFLAEVETILRKGKVKKYRHVSGNVKALKGRLNFPKNIKHNLLHKEKFFTEHQSFDYNNIFNIALKEALQIIAITSFSNSIAFKSKQLLAQFYQVGNKRLNENHFKNIKYHRNTGKYKDAIELARLIILNYQPNIMAGRNNTISLLFNMNVLFEQYVCYLLRRNAVSEKWNYNVASQKKKKFWFTTSNNRMTSKSIKPDIYLTSNKVASNKSINDENVNDKNEKFNCIIDAKWKLPSNKKPADSDLKQMFAYNIQFGARHSYLLYPSASEQTTTNAGQFAKSDVLGKDYRHFCGMMFLNIFDENNKLNRDAGNEIYKNITNITNITK